MGSGVRRRRDIRRTADRAVAVLAAVRARGGRRRGRRRRRGGDHRPAAARAGADDRGAAAGDDGRDVAGRHPGGGDGPGRGRAAVADRRRVGGRGAAVPRREHAGRRPGGGGRAAARRGAGQRARGRQRRWPSGCATRRSPTSPSLPDLLRARARLAESRGDYDEAHALWARLATAEVSADERAFYGALSAEWTLARSGRLPAVAREAIPAGPARTLARAEEALRTGTSAARPLTSPARWPRSDARWAARWEPRCSTRPRGSARRGAIGSARPQSGRPPASWIRRCRASRSGACATPRAPTIAARARSSTPSRRAAPARSPRR